MKTRNLDAATFTASLTSTPVDLGVDTDVDMALAALFLTNVTGTPLTVEASLNGSTWAPVVKTDGTDYEIANNGVTYEAVVIPPSDLCGLSMLRFVSPTTIATGSIVPVTRKV